jgi:hypothetical protein
MLRHLLAFVLALGMFGVLVTPASAATKVVKTNAATPRQAAVLATRRRHRHHHHHVTTTPSITAPAGS